MKAIEVVMDIFAVERIGIRFTPFASTKGIHSPNIASVYCALIESIASRLPNLGFVHFVAHTLFEDFEYASNKSLDVFRAMLAFPRDCGLNTGQTAFISADAYNPQTARRIASRSQDLVAISLPADVNPKLISSLRQDAPYYLARSTEERLQTVRTAFKTGKEYIVEWTTEHQSPIKRAMEDLDTYLNDFDPALSYEGTDQKLAWRKSCWFASEGIARPFLDTEQAIATFDGDLKDGLTGLRALQNPHMRSSLQYLKSVLDSALVTTSNAVGIGEEMIQRCSVRYRVIKYTPHAGSPGGIGLHPDGNLLSALITTGDGLRVYDLDGTIRSLPGYTGTIMMGGSTLYRWSEGKYLPTFHDVDIRDDQVKVSIVAFFNFPDMATIPKSLISREGQDAGFFHDIKKIKEDDKLPRGQLSALWDIIIERHKLILPRHHAAK
ncbi:hypothetical protein N7465_010383 [Penicillium sp. CMV-2018d]|nr:hypothetical protein N7465_010383 [Penicillium sp. CMV-2018d]